MIIFHLYMSIGLIVLQQYFKQSLDILPANDLDSTDTKDHSITLSQETRKLLHWVKRVILVSIGLHSD